MSSSPVTQLPGSLTAESPVEVGVVAPMTSSFEGVFDALMLSSYPLHQAAARVRRCRPAVVSRLARTTTRGMSAGERHGFRDVAAEHVTPVEQVVLPHQPR